MTPSRGLAALVLILLTALVTSTTLAAPNEPIPAPVAPVGALDLAPIPLDPLAAPVAAPDPAPIPLPPIAELAPLPKPPSSLPLIRRNFAGSIQLDYLAIPTDARARDTTLDGATVELSLKLAVDVGEHTTANVKLCVACHGPEVGMAFLELRGRDELNVRVGRFTPSFGSFPLRHDPANHRTSDKPLPYDMGRMIAYREWNLGILPAPWVDNGAELYGTHFFGAHQLDYAAYLIGGPKGTADTSDFDFTLSRSGERYYVDNNSQPTVGGRVGMTFTLAEHAQLTLGVSTMAGHYDPDATLGFLIAGADAVLQLGRTFLRAEYLARWTELAVGADPASRFKYGPGLDGTYDDTVLKDGFYVEGETPVGPVDLVARWDGLRRFGNVLAGSPLRSKSIVLRYTAGIAVRLPAGLRVKTSVEAYDFSDLDDQLALHLALVGTF